MTPGSTSESDYRSVRLREQRVLIRVACAITVLIAGLHTIEQSLGTAWSPWQPYGLGFVLAASALIALIAFTPVFERLYLPVANAVLPARSAVAAAFVTGAAASGRMEMLVFLPLMIVGPVFFFGLGWRMALVSGIATCLSFGASAAAFGLASPVALRTATLLLVVMSGCIYVARHHDAVDRAKYRESRRIADLAWQDALTGLRNRRVFDEALATLWQQAIEARRSLAIMLIDVDHFKEFNDRYGHQAGDHELCRVASCLERLVERKDDVLARYGGEEFAVILYDVDADVAAALAEAMRDAVEAADDTGRATSGPPAVTISIGVACIDPSSDRQPRGAVQLADQALYEAKESGRNRVALRDRSAHCALETGMFALTSMPLASSAGGDG